MLAQRIKEGSVSFVCRDVDSTTFWYVESSVVFTDLFRRQAHELVLKVTPSYVHAVINAVGIPKFGGFPAKLLDDASCCAVDFVDVSKMIANESDTKRQCKTTSGMSSELEQSRSPQR